MFRSRPLYQSLRPPFTLYAHLSHRSLVHPLHRTLQRPHYQRPYLHLKKISQLVQMPWIQAMHLAPPRPRIWGNHDPTNVRYRTAGAGSNARTRETYICSPTAARRNASRSRALCRVAKSASRGSTIACGMKLGSMDRTVIGTAQNVLVSSPLR